MSAAAQTLKALIREQGPVTFARFMEEALYGPGGYYVRELAPIGKGGDFVTGSSFSPLFGRATARVLERLDRSLGQQADFLEVGFGTGEHLAAVVAALDSSARRRVLAWDRAAREAPSGVESLDSFDGLGARSIRGLIFSYELFDALPFHRLVGGEAGEVLELKVGLASSGDFEFVAGELSEPCLRSMLDDSSVALLPGQIADLSSSWGPLYGRMAAALDRGLLVTFDYGFETRALLDPRIRFHGTLACYRRQQVHRNPFVEVGSQDLSAHVDLSVLRRAGEAAGLDTIALTRQARWLMACGLFEDLKGATRSERLEAMTLLNPEGMGEEIRVLVQSRGVSATDLFDQGLLIESQSALSA